MSPVRVFLGWNRPALDQAADWLLTRYSAAPAADMSRACVVLPGARAGRRLLELLVDQAERQRLALTPPQFTTIGHLPEKLYAPEGRFADPLSCQLAWLRALEETDADMLRRIAPEPPDRKDPSRWLSLADLMNRLHVELAGHGLVFADVAAQGFGRDKTESIAEAAEAERWRALAAIQEAYVRQLKKFGLLDVQLARLDVIAKHASRSDRDIVLVGVADPSPVVGRLLESLADRVTALVYAPEELADRFDKLGAIVTGAWRQARVEIDERRLVVADGPADQATAVVDVLAGYAGKYTADEITVGVPDTSVVPYLERRFQQFDLPSRYGEALRVKQTGPYRMLAAIADYLDGKRFADFAALVRHPDLEVWLARAPDAAAADVRAGDWLTAIDHWHSRHLPAGVVGGSFDGSGAAQRIAAIETKIAKLIEPFSKQRTLAEWAGETAALIVSVYQWRKLDRSRNHGRVVLEACEAIHNTLRQAFQTDVGLSGRWPAADALRLLLRQVEDEPIPPPGGHSAVEFLGWLELPLDDAPALVVTGFNDGFVPSFINSDPFLPNGLRRQLGLLDNDRRYARDAYALAVLIGSRDLHLVAGRRSGEGDPLSPSRLAFACPREQIARRVLGYFGIAAAAAPARVPHGLPAGQSRSKFAVPRPRPQEKPLTSLRVTQFREYLACPYRFYLRYVEEIAALNDAAEELDSLAFGSLAHDVLKAFGDWPENAGMADAEKIAAFLNSELDRLVRSQYGEKRLPAVRLQVEQLRLRLGAFARWQADWAAKGWRIVKTEVEVEDGVAPLVVDGEPMFLRGRVDRIDQNDRDGSYVIFDYKTSEKGEPPDATHRRKDGTWIDLQLPLYRHLAPAVQIDSPNIALGYILLPKSLAAVKGELATWQEDDLQAADSAASEVVRRIRDQDFWPPSEPDPRFDDFAAICLDPDKDWI